MDDYAGRVLADRYRLPLPPSDEYELAEARAFDTYSGQEVLVRQVPLPEVVEAEVLDEDDLPEGFAPRAGARPGGAGARRASARTTRRPTDPAVRRAMEAAQTAAQIPDHPRLDQVFDVFAEGGSLWIVSELVAARPLAALLADRPLSPYRAAEVAADVLAALRVLHAHGWVHRNITARTVLICDDGRVMLTGLAAGAAEEALCGYDPRPVEAGEATGSAGSVGNVAAYEGASQVGYEDRGLPLEPAPEAYEEVERGGKFAGYSRDGGVSRAAVRRAGQAVDAAEAAEAAGSARGEARAARGGSIAAYRAGAARASARVEEEPPPGTDAGGTGPGAAGVPGPRGGDTRPGTAGRIPDPYGVGDTKPWHGAVPRGGGQRGAVEGAERRGPGGGVGGPYEPRSPYESGARQGPRAPHEPRSPSEPGAQQGPRAPHEPRSPSEPGAQQGPRAPHEPRAPHQPQPPHAPHEPPNRHQPPAPTPASTREEHAAWDVADGEAGGPRGPATALAAERARHARMVVVGAVTERWAPEQAGPVHENWQLAAPIGPATDLWALGALLFRAVQGHAPYPEDSTAELVQLVCAEPPAFAEECGPLRPVVESLLRQDPTDRLDFEELSGWLRSLVRSAPEPEAGAHVVPVPPYDAGRLPVVRRRGEVVRRRRAAAPATTGGHGRHKRGRSKAARAPREPQRFREAPPREAEPVREAGPKRAPRAAGSARPRSLGRLLLLAILVGLAAAVAYAMLFLPKAGEKGADGRAGTVGEASAGPSHDENADESGDKGEGDDEGDGKASNDPSSQEARTNGPNDPELPQGFTLRKDTEGFRVAVARGWDRQPKNGRGQVRYTHGGFELLVVPGRDTTDGYGSDPMKYQREHERELQPFRDSSWATSSGMRRIDVGGRTMAEGQFTWQDGEGREVYVRNLAMIVGGKYHVVQVRGPEAERDEVTRLFEQASKTYQVTD
ncbi:protein kinase [Streptomyces sp. NPDC018059]|uniref:protein kinase n=1 Tax=Streptomyces sp. NPDC018059 TaxID=3365041 RepID=UPI0037A4180D